MKECLRDKTLKTLKKQIKSTDIGPALLWQFIIIVRLRAWLKDRKKDRK